MQPPSFTAYVPPASAPVPATPLATATSVALNPVPTVPPAGPTTSVPTNVALGAGTALGTSAAIGLAAGAEVPIIAGGINVIVEYFKNRSWFHDDHWTVPLLILLSFVCAIVVYHFIAHDTFKAVTNGFGILTNAHVNFHGARATGLGILSPVAPENKWQPRA